MNILVVEDTQETLSFLKHALKEEGFVVDTASDGEIGLRKAMANDYDIAILDNVLPGRTGREICSEIRKKGSGVRILMLSVENRAGMKAEALDLGADDYLSKPFSLEELLARLRALLRRPSEAREEVIQVGSLSLDTKSREVRRSGHEISLTRREFNLLEYMMRNRGKILSRTRILEHVWDMNADLFTNTVEMHIMSLRKKIAIKGEKPLIFTISGAGYKLA